MFVRRSFSSLYNLTVFNIVCLTYCLLVIGHVSSMSLDRHKRQHQQQNDKQLGLSGFMLPEAESELLQNDMELVPAVDGNSDMYLLVPASAASQEQNLQTLTEVNESQNSGNIESSSDMLMQESEDTPAVQVLQLPEELKTKIREQLVASNELDQKSYSAAENKEQMLNNDEKVSANTLNNLADAAQEIKNEIETELISSEQNTKTDESAQAEYAKQEEGAMKSEGLSEDQANSEPENADASVQEQEMIGVVKEVSNEMPTRLLESQDTQETDETINDGETQPEEENPSAIEKNKSGENFEEIKNEAVATNQVNEESQKLKGDENLKGEQPEISTETVYQQKVEENVALQPEDTKPNDTESQAANELPSETVDVEKVEVVEQPLAVEDAQAVNKTQTNQKHQVDEQIETLAQDIPNDVDEAKKKIDAVRSEETKDEAIRTEETHEIKAEEVKAEKNPLENETQPENEEEGEGQFIGQGIPSEPETESLQESQDFVENESVQNIQPFEDIDNLKNSTANADKSDKDTLLDNENWELSPVATSDEYDEVENLNSEYYIDENLDKADEETIADIKPGVMELNEGEAEYENQKKEEIRPIEVSQQVEVQGNESVQQNVEENAENTQDFQDNDEPQTIKDIESNEKVQSDGEIQTIDNVQPDGEIEAADVQNIKDVELQEVEIAEEGQITESVQEEPAQYTQTTEINEVADDIEPVEEAQPEQSQSTTNSQTNEEYKPAGETFYNEEQPQYIGNEEIAEADQATDAPHTVNTAEEETQTDAVVFDQADTTLEDAKPSASANEPTLDETESIEMQPLVPSPELQQYEIHQIDTQQQESTSDESKPLEVLADKDEESNHQEDENTAGQLNVGDEDNTTPNLIDVTTEIQNASGDKNNDNILSNDTSESESIKETASILTTIVQVPTSAELTQQQQQQHEEHQTAFVETASSTTTLKPFNNANENIKQDVEEEQQAFSSKLRRYDGAQVWRIVVQNDKERKLADELQTKYDGQLWKEVKQEVDYLLKPQVLADAERYVRVANLSRIVLIDNLQKVIEVENPPAEEIAQLQNRKGYRLTWQAYHRLEDIHGYFDYLAKTYPDICSVEIIGYSIEKRPLKILKISNGNANNTGIWIDGGMHAREWISPSVVTYIAHQIVEGWEELPAYMRNINWYVHAVANPDGYEYSHTTDRLWRKNMRSHGRVCPGVDLNRNFGYKWGGKGTSANPCSQTYRGSKAFSEPETFYISKYISNFPRDTFKGYLSFHSYGQYILYPWGYDYHITPDMADLDLVARQAGTIITKSTGAKFTVGSSATTLYAAAGGSDDWAKGIAGIKYAYTIEMGDTGRYGFVLPADYIEPNGKNGLTVVETVAKAITMGKNGRRRKLKAYKKH